MGGHGIALKRYDAFFSKLESVIETGYIPKDNPDSATFFGSLSAVAAAMLVITQLF